MYFSRTTKRGSGAPLTSVPTDGPLAETLQRTTEIYFWIITNVTRGWYISCRSHVPACRSILCTRTPQINGNIYAAVFGEKGKKNQTPTRRLQLSQLINNIIDQYRAKRRDYLDGPHTRRFQFITFLRILTFASVFFVNCVNKIIRKVVLMLACKFFMLKVIFIVPMTRVF